MTTKKLVTNGVIAAIYVALTLSLAPFSYGPIQVRVSEALTLLPFLCPSAMWGVFAGCLLANLLNPLGINILDVAFGSLATLLACYFTSKCKRLWLAAVPPVVFNALIIGPVLAYMYAPETFALSAIIFGGQVGLGQIIACFGLGIPLVLIVKRMKIFDTAQ